MLIQPNLIIAPTDKNDFDEIVQYISQFELDNRALEPDQFLVAKHQNVLVGFGRIRSYADCEELCSLGVIENERLKGIGKELAKALVKKARKPLYLVCIIPEFFEPHGFKITKNYPIELQDKLSYCTNELVVKETYVVMKKG